VLVSPNPKSQALGQTSLAIAASGATVNGYAEVLSGNRVGFVPIGILHDYRSPANPHVVCAIAGLRQDGSPVFVYRTR
jgi:hypothetical protein